LEKGFDPCIASGPRELGKEVGPGERRANGGFGGEGNAESVTVGLGYGETPFIDKHIVQLIGGGGVRRGGKGGHSSLPRCGRDWRAVESCPEDKEVRDPYWHVTGPK